jgi:hypothetical protein
MMENLKFVAEMAGYPDPQSPVVIIGALIGVCLSFLGIIFLCLMIYSGFVWMTSAGSEQKILIAKKTIINATIGLFIILASYSISKFITDSLYYATQ